MLYHLLNPLGGPFNVFRYITFRAACATMTALILAYVLFPPFIEWMRRKKMEQIIRTDGPQAHVENKVGTPTMGGVVIHGAVAGATLLWARTDELLVWMIVAITLGYALIGLYDDWKKVMERSADGLAGRWKLFWQTTIAGVVFGVAYATGRMDATLHVPFYKHAVVDFAELWTGAPDVLGWGYVAFGATMTSAATFAVLCYVAGHTEFSEYLRVPHVDGGGELAVFMLAIVGAGLGFLWYNAYPAQVFMGDVGSLGLGGALGSVAVLTKNEFLMALVGGVFVLEALSVTIQVVSFKTRGKRVFLMAPIHHHYEKQGWSEPKIIVRFWIISVLMALVALSTLKLR